MAFDSTGMVIDQGTQEVTVPPGKYVLGDPCYTFPGDHWTELLYSCNFFKGQAVGKAAGLEVVAFDTAYGDGLYFDQEGNEYPVDAGMLGLVPVFEGIDFSDTLGMIVEFTEPTLCKTDGMGRMKFGHYEINTNDADEDDDWFGVEDVDIQFGEEDCD